ncbi:MAG: hypothetical protein ACE5K0_10910 [Candidatus Methanofastidiosia archaeon]
MSEGKKRWKKDLDLLFLKVKESEDEELVEIFPFLNYYKDKSEEFVEIFPFLEYHKDKKSGKEDVRFFPFFNFHKENKSFGSFGEFSKKSRKNWKLGGIAFGLFIMLVGTVWTLENTSELYLDGVILFGTGLILLGLNLSRYFAGIKTSKVTVILGILLLILGAGDYFAFDVPVVALLLILIGAYIIFKSLR